MIELLSVVVYVSILFSFACAKDDKGRKVVEKDDRKLRGNVVLIIN